MGPFCNNIPTFNRLVFSFLRWLFFGIRTSILSTQLLSSDTLSDWAKIKKSSGERGLNFISKLEAVGSRYGR